MECDELRHELLDLRPISVDFFAGVGGLSLGLEYAGFFSAAQVEIDALAARYANYNFPFAQHFGGTANGDIRKVTSAEIRTSVEDREITLIAGGPPCQGFSNVGRRRVDDPLNDLVLEMARLVLELEPKAFLIENVPGIRGDAYWQLDKALSQLSKAYQCTRPSALFAPDYGVPQIRKRVFILGIRQDMHIVPKLPVATHSASQTGQQALLPLLRTPTVADALFDLPDCDKHAHLIDEDEAPYEAIPHSTYAFMMREGIEIEEHKPYHVGWSGEICTNIRRTQHGPDLVDRLRNLEQGQTDAASRIKRLRADGLSTTIRAGTTADRGAWSAPRPCHPYLPRVLTTRECSKLQSFPDWFRFHPSKWHGNRQVGNAVPPLLAKAVGSSLLRSLGIAPPETTDLVVQRDESLIAVDIATVRAAGLSGKRVSHQVVGTDRLARSAVRS